MRNPSETRTDRMLNPRNHSRNALRTESALENHLDTKLPLISASLPMSNRVQTDHDPPPFHRVLRFKCCIPWVSLSRSQSRRKRMNPGGRGSMPRSAQPSSKKRLRKPRPSGTKLRCCLEVTNAIEYPPSSSTRGAPRVMSSGSESALLALLPRGSLEAYHKVYGIPVEVVE
jgi:hypothetical protein